MAYAFLLGRLIFGGFFLMSGLNHFRQLETMSQYASQGGVPLASAAVLLSGAMLIVGGLSVIVGAWPRIGVALLVTFLVIVSFAMHDFWNIDDAQARAMELSNFLKNAALAGAGLILATIPEPWPLSVDHARRGPPLRIPSPAR